VVLAVSHLAPAIAECLAAWKAELDLPITVRAEDSPLGSGGALRNCQDLLEPHFVLLNGDILTNLRLGPLVSFHQTARALVTATLSEVDDPTRFGIADLDEAGRIRCWQEKPSLKEARSRWGNVGAWVINRGLLDFIPEGRMTSLEKDTFPILLRQGVPFFGHQFSGYWSDIGTLKSYVQGNRDLLAGCTQATVQGTETRPGVWIAPSADVPADVTLIPPVCLGSGCRLGPGCELIGPTVVGADCELGRNVILDQTIVWDHARIGDGTRVQGSVIASCQLGRQCLVREGCVVASHSQLGDGRQLEAGTLLGPSSVLP
jgi:NDP-sugar pyrophosphorylase family protein